MWVNRWKQATLVVDERLTPHRMLEISGDIDRAVRMKRAGRRRASKLK